MGRKELGTDHWSPWEKALQAIAQEPRSLTEERRQALREAPDYLALESEIRAARAAQAWDQLGPEQVYGSLQGDPWLLALATMHRGGYVRQRALQLLLANLLPELLPFLLLRLVDHVPVIRATAQTALLETMTDGWRPAWRQHWTLAVRLSLREHRDWVSSWIAWFRGESSLIERGMRDHPLARRRLVELLLSDPNWIPDVAMLEHSAPEWRRATALALARGPLPIEVRRILARDRFPDIRLLALRPGDGGEQQEMAHLLLFDKARRVRELASFLLRKNGQQPLALYLAALSETSPSASRQRAALLGIGELPRQPFDGEAISLLNNCLDSPFPKVRQAAVTICGREGQEVRQLLDDSSPGVARAAFAVLAQDIGEEKLVEYLDHEFLVGVAIQQLVQRFVFRAQLEILRPDSHPLLGRLKTEVFLETCQKKLDSKSWLRPPPHVAQQLAALRSGKRQVC